MEKIIVFADKHKLPLWHIISDINNFETGLNTGAVKKVEDFVTMIKSMTFFNKSKNAFEMAQLIAKESGVLQDLYADKSPEGVSRFENIEELVNGIRAFVENDEYNDNSEIKKLEDFVQSISLLTDADKDEKNLSVVSLMTIHSAKGLEFPYVFISGVEENLFPSLMSLNSRPELEEERRLFYVAVTRAMTKLYIHYAESRFKWGNIHFCEPSRFIDEIDPCYLDFENEKEVDVPIKKTEKQWRDDKKSVTEKKSKQYFTNSLPSNFKKVNNASKGESKGNINSELEIGMYVTHERFGNGKLVSLDGIGDNKKAVVLFDKEGQKQLLLKYAKLKIIEN